MRHASRNLLGHLRRVPAGGKLPHRAHNNVGNAPCHVLEHAREHSGEHGYVAAVVVVVVVVGGVVVGGVAVVIVVIITTAAAAAAAIAIAGAAAAGAGGGGAWPTSTVVAIRGSCGICSRACCRR